MEIGFDMSFFSSVGRFYVDIFSKVFWFPMGTIGALFTTFVHFVILCILWYIIDSWFTSRKDGVGVVVEKDYHNQSGDFSKPKMFIKVVLLEDTEKEDLSMIEVVEVFFKEIKEGDNIRIRYAKGRLSKSLYVKEVLGKV